MLDPSELAIVEEQTRALTTWLTRIQGFLLPCDIAQVDEWMEDDYYGAFLVRLAASEWEAQRRADIKARCRLIASSLLALGVGIATGMALSASSLHHP